MEVDVNEVLYQANERRIINSQKLKDIEFFKDGKRIEIPADAIKDWEFTGLNNENFITNHEWPSLEDIEDNNF